MAAWAEQGAVTRAARLAGLHLEQQVLAAHRQAQQAIEEAPAMWGAAGRQSVSCAQASAGQRARCGLEPPSVSVTRRQIHPPQQRSSCICSPHVSHILAARLLHTRVLGHCVSPRRRQPNALQQGGCEGSAVCWAGRCAGGQPHSRAACGWRKGHCLYISRCAGVRAAGSKRHAGGSTALLSTCHEVHAGPQLGVQALHPLHHGSGRDAAILCKEQQVNRRAGPGAAGRVPMCPSRQYWQQHGVRSWCTGEARSNSTAAVLQRHMIPKGTQRGCCNSITEHSTAQQAAHPPRAASPAPPRECPPLSAGRGMAANCGGRSGWHAFAAHQHALRHIVRCTAIAIKPPAACRPPPPHTHLCHAHSRRQQRRLHHNEVVHLAQALAALGCDGCVSRGG